MVDIIGTKDLTEERRAQFANELATWFQDTLGLPSEMLFYDIMGKALGILQTQVLEVEKQQYIDAVAQQKLWAAERRLIDANDYLQKYGISELELRMAVNSQLLRSEYPPSVNRSFWNQVVSDRPLTPDELTTLADSVMLTANQAAERLGVNRKAFDRLKQKHNLQPAEMRRSRGREGLFAVYRLSDLDRLKSI